MTNHKVFNTQPSKKEIFERIISGDPLLFESSDQIIEYNLLNVNLIRNPQIRGDHHIIFYSQLKYDIKIICLILNHHNLEKISIEYIIEHSTIKESFEPNTWIRVTMTQSQFNDLMKKNNIDASKYLTAGNYKNNVYQRRYF